MTVFAKANDKFGKQHYFAADSEEEIEIHCEGGVLGDELAIEHWINYVDPIMVTFHFKWLGKRRNPFVVAKPFEYGVPVEKQKWAIEKW